MRGFKCFLIVFFLSFFCCWQILTQPIFAREPERKPENIYPEFSDISFPPLTHPFEAESLAKYVKYVFTFMIFGGIILALLVLIFAGLRYLYSADNPNIKADAKDQIKKAFLGMFFLLVSYNILLILGPEFVIVSPTTLEARRIMVNFLKRPKGRSVSVEKLLEQLQPSKIDLEIVYPEMRKFQPSYIPFTEALPYYPLNLLVEQYINYIYNWSVPIGIILALIVVIVGGVKYMSAGGDPKKVSDAKNQILCAFLGLLLLLTSWHLLYTFAPEFVLIKPEELPEIEAEIPEGVYFCSERAPMIIPEKDLFEVYVINQFQKKAFNKTEQILTKKMLQTLSLFVNAFCERFESSVNLAPEITGEKIEIKADEVSKILEEVPGLTPEEKQQIIGEVAGNIQFEGAPHLYINGEYGVVLHEKKDFKGWGRIFFLPSLYNYLPFSEFNPGMIQPYKNYTTLIPFSPRSITIFEDLVLKCYIDTKNSPGSPAGYRRLKICLNWAHPPTNSPRDTFIYENITFFMFKTPDFGGFEEGLGEPNEGFSFRFDHLYPSSGGTAIYPQLTSIRNVSKTLDKFDPFYSFKFPRGAAWFAIVGTYMKKNTERGPIELNLMYVFQNDEKDFGATYVRSFGGINRHCSTLNQPCITGIFVWPGKILKNI